VDIRFCKQVPISPRNKISKRLNPYLFQNIIIFGLQISNVSLGHNGKKLSHQL
jgi:hypothetical protein